MNLKWVFRRLTSRLSPPLKAQTFQDALSLASTLVLDHVHMSHLLSACGREGCFCLGSSLHASIIKKPELHDPRNEDLFGNCPVVWNSLLSMYVRCEDVLGIVKLLDEMPVKDTISWNTALCGFLRNGEFEMGFGMFKRMWEGGARGVDKATVTTILSSCDGRELSLVVESMHGIVFRGGFEREITIGNALITFYFKCGGIDWGMWVFNEMFERNVISWTAVISSLQQNEFYEDSLKLFMSMRSGSIYPNTLTYLSSITACAGLQAINAKQQRVAKLAAKARKYSRKKGQKSIRNSQSRQMDELKLQAKATMQYVHTTFQERKNMYKLYLSDGSITFSISEHPINLNFQVRETNATNREMRPLKIIVEKLRNLHCGELDYHHGGHDGVPYSSGDANNPRR